MELKKYFRMILSIVMVATLILGSISMLAGCQTTDNNPNTDNNNAKEYEGLEKEEYLQKLGENNLGELVDSVGEFYGGFLSGLNSSSSTEQTVNTRVNMTLTVGDSVMDLLEMAIFGGKAPVDISSLQEISLDMDMATKGQVQAMQLVLGLKGQNIITANLLTNMAESVSYICLPELNDQWLKVKADKAAADMIASSLSSSAMMAKLTDALPDAETLTKLLDRYIAIILAELKNVEQSTTTLEVGGVKQECTVLTLKIYEKDALNIAKAVLTAAKDDADLKKIIEDVAKAVEEMAGEDIGAAEAYTDFKEAVVDALNAINQETDLDTESFIQLDTYVDKDHNIIGMKLDTLPRQGSERGLAYFYSLTEGDKTAFEFAVPSDAAADANDFKLSGTGTKKDGKLSGTYTVSVGELNNLLTIAVEDLDDKSGTITLTPSMDVIKSLVGQGLDSFGALALQIKLSEDGVTVNLTGDSKLLLGIALKTLQSNNPSLTAPSDAVDATDASALEKWTEKLVLDKVMDNLEKVGAAEFFQLLFAVQQAPQEMPAAA